MFILIIPLFILIIIVASYFLINNNSLYGTIRGWYSSKRSIYLYDRPIRKNYYQMIRNLKKSNELWKILHIPTAEQLPNYGDWWNWTTELQIINRVIDYLGNTLGRFETHIGAISPFANKLTWVKRNNPVPTGVLSYYEIINVGLKTALTNIISNSANQDASISFTQEQWDAFNITTNITTLHYINLDDGSQYKPYSSIMDNLNNEAATIIKRDINNDSFKFVAMYSKNAGFPTQADNRTIDNNLKVEECGGVCLWYETKQNINRQYIWFDIGPGHEQYMNSPSFLSFTNDKKARTLRQLIISILGHEYAHVFQFQVLSPTYPTRWAGEYFGFGELAPNRISPWWMECFAYLLPLFMELGLPDWNFTDKITEAINEIKNVSETLFIDTMFYISRRGRLTKIDWGYLTAAYMAKLTSWKNILVDWYYDFQRIPSDTQAYNSIKNETITVPNTDNLFLHHFGKTEEDLLKDAYQKVINNVITLDYLSNVLPNGADYGIPGLVPFTI